MVIAKENQGKLMCTFGWASITKTYAPIYSIGFLIEICDARDF